ncbi:VOC family protein [Aestuariicoccus sp. MJ-SS9]|uniref:VOC family protein n=1 Tax=Aestuariicoccus sp. MJ-SS9 TaxID=3079855 RepID=UPI00290D3751|nr:VOC family protein [Aestuariicoccus sp. MJ-SS9]MDU8910277.1 VOC family protein [Aestuariicoccus sp. MJ-SS9]
MEQRISLITLGARDITRLAAFYEALGWRRVETPEGIVVFDLIGQALGLYPLADLARDMGLPEDGLGRGAATYAYNVRDKTEVAELLAQAEAAGAQVLQPAHDVFWGGHIGYFADPEGHIWEVAWNPFSSLGPDGAFRWSGY